MPKFAANLSMMFTEMPFLDRFAAAAQAGFSGVEFLFPYAYKIEEIAQRLEDNGLTLALFNLPPGDWDKGERGLAALPDRRDDFDAALAQALPYIAALKPRCLHMMAGILPDDADMAFAEAAYVASLDAAGKAVAAYRAQVLGEPINARDMPGYFLRTQAQAMGLLTRVEARNVGLQMDFYHCQVVEGDLVTNLTQNLSSIGHMQVASVPERHEPDGLGEINYPYLFELIDQLGYEDWIGCEYNPRGKTLDGLDWCRAFLNKRG